MLTGIFYKNVLLSLPKHLARPVRINTPSGAGEMLRQAQQDALFEQPFQQSLAG
jgi:hypothetical protein